MRCMTDTGVSTTAAKQRNILKSSTLALSQYVGESDEKIHDDFGSGGSRPGYDQYVGERPSVCRSGRARAKLHADRQTGGVPGPRPVLRARLCQSLRPISLLVPSVQLIG
jgi:hypothetical protein